MKKKVIAIVCAVAVLAAAGGGVTWHFLGNSTKEDSIRDVIAFPKVKDASCLMTEAPSPVDAAQLEELGLEVELQAEEETTEE